MSLSGFRPLVLTGAAVLVIALLLPSRDADVLAALRLPSASADRLIVLETQHRDGTPTVDDALEMAVLYIEGRRPDWAIHLIDRVLKVHPNDHRLFSRKAMALAEHLDGTPAHAAAAKALLLCESGSAAPCPPHERQKLMLLEQITRETTGVDLEKTRGWLENAFVASYGLENPKMRCWHHKPTTCP